MTDSVTLYRKEPLVKVGDEVRRSVFRPVGEFVSRPWCKAHDNEWRDVPGIQQGCDGGNEFKPCELADDLRLVQVIPDDH